jgi:hypothetical protein
MAEVFFGQLHLVHGCFPPHKVLNDILSAGGLVDGDRAFAFQWQPFTLSEAEYSELRREVLANPQWGVEIDDSFQDRPSDWGHWAFERALNKGTA